MKLLTLSLKGSFFLTHIHICIKMQKYNAKYMKGCKHMEGTYQCQTFLITFENGPVHLF